MNILRTRSHFSHIDHQFLSILIVDAIPMTHNSPLYWLITHFATVLNGLFRFLSFHASRWLVQISVAPHDCYQQAASTLFNCSPPRNQLHQKQASSITERLLTMFSVIKGIRMETARPYPYNSRYRTDVVVYLMAQNFLFCVMKNSDSAEYSSQII